MYTGKKREETKFCKSREQLVSEIARTKIWTNWMHRSTEYDSSTRVNCVKNKIPFIHNCYIDKILNDNKWQFHVHRIEPDHRAKYAIINKIIDKFMKKKISGTTNVCSCFFSEGKNHSTSMKKRREFFQKTENVTATTIKEFYSLLFLSYWTFTGVLYSCRIYCTSNTF